MSGGENPDAKPAPGSGGALTGLPGSCL